MINRASVGKRPAYHETGKEDNPLSELCSLEVFCQYLINKMCKLLEEPETTHNIIDIKDLSNWL